MLDSLDLLMREIFAPVVCMVRLRVHAAYFQGDQISNGVHVNLSETLATMQKGTYPQMVLPSSAGRIVGFVELPEAYKKNLSHIAYGRKIE